MPATRKTMKSTAAGAADRRAARAYVAAQPDPARKALKALRDAILSVAPDATEGFSYRIPAFRLDDKAFLWIAGFKQHVSLYPMTGKIRRMYAAELAPYKMSTGTIQFPLEKPIPAALVKKLVRARVQEVRVG